MACHNCKNNPCETVDCTCRVRIGTDCSTYTGENLLCSGIPKGTPLTQLIQLLDEFICQKFNSVAGYFKIVNIGEGLDVYAEDNMLGEKQLRSFITTGDLLTSVENEQDITFTINEEALIDFINENQKLTVVSNAGTTGETLVKTEVVTGDTTTYPIKRLIHSAQDGEGESFVRDLQVNTDDLTLRTKKLKTNTLSITSNEKELIIDIAASSQIPALYVNNRYEPTYEEWLAENKAQNSGTAVVGFEFIGKGTLAQPFTDTRVFTLNSPSTPPTITDNTAIQNALDTYVGDTDIYSRLDPQLSGQKIIIQNNSSNYTFNNDLNYSNLYLVHECNVNYTTSGYLIDMDDNTAFDSDNSKITLEIKEGVTVQVNGNGFRNSGNTSTTPPSYTSGRICILIGDGEIYNDYNGVDVLTKYIFNGNGNNNDDGLHFQVGCKVRALYQGIYKTVNKMRIDFYNQLTSGIFLGNINTNIKAFHMEGGQVRFYEKGSIALSSEISGRLYGITFNPIEDCNFQLNSAKVSGTSENCFVKLADGNVSFLAFNSPSGDGFATTLMGTSTLNNGLFENLGSTPWGVEFKNNVFSYTGINFDKVDLTRGNGTSSINFIGGDVIETLVVFSTKANAISAGRAKGSKILKRVTVNMANFVSGVEYQISALGTGVNWTSIGASAGTLGMYFTYNGVTVTGSGGQATQSSIEIL